MVGKTLALKKTPSLFTNVFFQYFQSQSNILARLAAKITQIVLQIIKLMIQRYIYGRLQKRYFQNHSSTVVLYSKHLHLLPPNFDLIIKIKQQGLL